MSALLEVSGLTKRFGGLTAVKDVAFALAPGEITGILGPNGAGKTTLFNLLTGFIPSDTGHIVFDGAPIRGLKPFRIVNRGLARTFQLTRPFIGMTVLENVVVGCLAPRVRADGADREPRPPHARSRRARTQGRPAGRRAALWRSAPPRDRPRAGDAAEAPAARRAFRRPRHQRDRAAWLP